MANLSRRKISNFVATRILAGDKDVISKLAALLVEENRTKEADILVRDIEDALSSQGVVVADVVSARGLSEDSKNEIEKFLKLKQNATQVLFREKIDGSVLGGVRLSVPGGEMDATIQRKLMKLKATKI